MQFARKTKYVLDQIWHSFCARFINDGGRNNHRSKRDTQHEYDRPTAGRASGPPQDAGPHYGVGRTSDRTGSSRYDWNSAKLGMT